jgi:hypothetical protein
MSVSLKELTLLKVHQPVLSSRKDEPFGRLSNLLNLRSVRKSVNVPKKSVSKSPVRFMSPMDRSTLSQSQSFVDLNKKKKLAFKEIHMRERSELSVLK